MHVADWMYAELSVLHRHDGEAVEQNSDGVVERAAVDRHPLHDPRDVPRVLDSRVPAPLERSAEVPEHIGELQTVRLAVEVEECEAQVDPAARVLGVLQAADLALNAHEVNHVGAAVRDDGEPLRAGGCEGGCGVESSATLQNLQVGNRGDRFYRLSVHNR